MGKEWEKKQMKRLVDKQQIKIAEIKTELEKEARVIEESQLFSQNNLKNTVTLIAAASENNVSAIIKKIDPKKKIRYERHAVKAPKVVHKVILKKN